MHCLISWHAKLVPQQSLNKQGQMLLGRFELDEQIFMWARRLREQIAKWTTNGKGLCQSLIKMVHLRKRENPSWTGFPNIPGLGINEPFSPLSCIFYTYEQSLFYCGMTAAMLFSGYFVVASYLLPRHVISCHPTFHWCGIMATSFLLKLFLKKCSST